MKKLFFTWPGIGDNLLLFAAAHNIYKSTGEKVFVASKMFDLLHYCQDFIEYINWFSFEDLYLPSQAKENKLKQIESAGFIPVFVSSSGYKYLAPTYESNVTTWYQKHMITRYCERMGYSGEVELSIPIVVPDSLTSTPRSYICVMCGGLQNYKSIPNSLMQAIVNEIGKIFQVVQIGSSKDPLLERVLDFRGGSLISAYRILRGAKFFIGNVGGLMHLAKAANCRSLILGTKGEPNSMSRYSTNVYVYPIDYCDRCSLNLRDPQHQKCFFAYKCIRNITANQVLDAISENIDFLISRDNCPEYYEIAEADPVNGLEDFIHSTKTLSCESALYKG